MESLRQSDGDSSREGPGWQFWIDRGGTFNEAAGYGRSNPLVVVLDGDLCFEDLLRGLPDLFSNVILVAMADENQVESLGPQCIVLRPQQEAEVLKYLDAVIQ